MARKSLGGVPEVEAFPAHLAADRRLAAGTQTQAPSAILLLDQKVLDIELPKVGFIRAKRPERLPVVLSVDEVRAVLGGVAGTH